MHYNYDYNQTDTESSEDENCRSSQEISSESDSDDSLSDNLCQEEVKEKVIKSFKNTKPEYSGTQHHLNVQKERIQELERKLKEKEKAREEKLSREKEENIAALKRKLQITRKILRQTERQGLHYANLGVFSHSGRT